MKNKLMTLLLLLVALHTGHAQDVIPPNGGEPGFKWDIAELNGTNYPSLAKAFEAVSADGQAITLLAGTTVKETIEVGFNTTLVLAAYPLEFTTDAVLNIADGKTLSLTGTPTTRHSGSLKLTGKGKLYAGADVNLSGLSVLNDTGADLYRILVTVPPTGTVTAATYGGKPVTLWASSSGTVSCWLPQSVVARQLVVSVESNGNTENYQTDPLTATLHASNAVETRKQDAGQVSYVATVGSKSFETIAAALTEVETTGGTVDMIASAPLGVVAKPEKAVTLYLNGFTLSSSGTAGLEPTNNGSLTIANSATPGAAPGRVTGTLSVNGRCVIARDVTLTASILMAGKQVYRTRLTLPPDGTDPKYSYGGTVKTTLVTLAEGTDRVAYLWLPVRSAAPFYLYLTDNGGNEQVTTKYDVAIQAGHDNQVDLGKGDTEAILYPSAADIDNPSKGTPFSTFHMALTEAGKLNGSCLVLTRNVSFSGENEHDHVILANVRTELMLQGYLLTATNCTLDATAQGACLVISDKSGRARVEGTFRIKGNVYIGNDIMAGNIGNVYDGEGAKPQLYRVLAYVKNDGPTIDGEAAYDWGSGSRTGACQVRGNTACVWLPLGAQAETLTLTVGGETYTAKDVRMAASHGNTITVKRPDVVASFGGQTFTSLEDAFEAAIKAKAAGKTVTLERATTLGSILTTPDGQDLTLDLKGYALTANAQGGFATTGTGRLTLIGEVGKAALAGNLTVDGDIQALSSVSISATVSQGGETVYRTRLLLPIDTRAGDYTYGPQTGTLRLTDERNDLGTMAVAYAWLSIPAAAQDLVANLTDPVPGSKKTLPSVLIQATHNNLLDMNAGGDMAMDGPGNYYPSLETALQAVAQTGGTVTLTRDATLRGAITLTAAVTLNLSNHNLAATADATLATSGNGNLRIKDGLQGGKGLVYGTLMVRGDVVVSREVKLSATVIRDGRKVFRTMVEGLPPTVATASYRFIDSDDNGVTPSLDGTAYLWLPLIEGEEDVRITANGNDYTAFVRPTSAEHANLLRAFPYYKVSGKDGETWADDTHNDADIEIAPGLTLTIADNSNLKSVRRLTMGAGSRVVTTLPVLATEGIRYRKGFDTPDTWEAFSLPFEPRAITTVIGGKAVALSPYLASGTGGHFWLQTLNDGDNFVYVDEDRIEANKGYIIAVPENLSTANGNPDRLITFVSAGNQFLNRASLPAELPAGKRFALLANGSLTEASVATVLYLLDAKGKEYIRQEGVSATKPGKIPPFGSYLLVEPRTAAQNSSFRLAGLPTGNEAVEAVPFAPLPWRIYTGAGTVLIEADEAMTLTIHDLGGRPLLVRDIPAGQTRLALPGGNYIINRVKTHIP